MRFVKAPLSLIITSTLLTACGSGSSSSSSSTPSTPSSPRATHTGYFIDGPVKGLQYLRNQRPPAQSTPADGAFGYIPGEVVAFSLGNISLGSLTPDPDSPFVTPSSLAGGNDNIRVNIARFLMTIDADGNPENGIEISPAALTAANNFAEAVDFADFDNGPLAAFAAEANNDGPRSVVDAATAKAHLDASEADLADGQFDYDGGKDSDNDGINDAVDRCPDTAAGAVVDKNGCVDNTDSQSDADNDGIANIDDNCPDIANPGQQDLDRDLRGDACDADADGDGIPNDDESETDPLNADSDSDGSSDGADNCPTIANSDQQDTDGDGEGDACDIDSDNDGVANDDDAFPTDANESVDTDGDGIGNNADPDDDNDGVNDEDDAFPLDAAESVDTDGDGIGNNADPDDDNDGVNDEDDAFPLDDTESLDSDGDGIGNNADPDDDNDGVNDEDDAFPFDSGESADHDGDGIGNNADPDDDNDNVNDEEDAFPFDDSETADNDGDGIGDNADPDDDNDGTPDEDDSFPFDESEQSDSDADGVGDNSDSCPDTASEAPVNNTGCSADQIHHASCADQFNLAGNRSYQVVIPVVDTTGVTQQVSFQVLEPATFDCDNIARGAHPLMLHGPGYGSSRSTSGFNNFRSDGYTVVSWDPRGYGDTSGSIRVMDPEFEGRYLIAILDWLEQNLDYLAWRNEATGEFVSRPLDASSVVGGDNLLVGSQGGSYGGGYQLLLLTTDPKKRLDAIAPDITWHDLRDALNPGDAVKTLWGLALSGLGNSAGSASLVSPETIEKMMAGQNVAFDDGQDPFIQETFARALAVNQWPRQSLDWFEYRGGLGHWCKASNLPTMPYLSYGADTVPMADVSNSYNVPPRGEDGRESYGDYLREPLNPQTEFSGLDVLITQGMTDTLFNYNHAWWNYQCLSAAGANVTLYTHNGGHVLPFAQSPDSPTQDAGSCGFYSSTEQQAWFNARLKPLNASPATLPDTPENDTCFALGTNGDTVKLAAADVIAPRGSSNYTRRAISAAVVPNGGSGVANLTGNLPVAAPIGTIEAGNGAVLAGIPHLKVTVSSLAGGNEQAQDCSAPALPTDSGCDSITFVGIGKKAPGGGNFVLIDDQLQPVRGLGEHDIDLVGIAERLNNGDELAVLFYAVHPQFASSASRDVTLPAVTIDGMVSLPLYAVDDAAQPDPSKSTDAVLPGADPDTDGDGVPNDSDNCPATAEGAAVDETGCSAEQVANASGFAVCTPDNSRCIATVPELGPPLQGAADQIYANLVDGGAPLPANGEVVLHAAQAQVQGCDILDPSHCLFPFPSDHFTVAASEGSIQSASRGGSDRRINFNILGMPRNSAGKPIDPSEWNRNDGFSPGQMLLTFVPGLAANEDGTIPGAPRLTHLSESLDLEGSSILVLDAETGEPHPIWAEIDLNAGLLLPGSNLANPDPGKAPRAAVIIRPARNFDHGKRYVAVLRRLPSANSDDYLAAQPSFRTCRDQQTTAIPQLGERCAQWDANVRPVLENAGIAINHSDLYLAWDFTVASAENTVNRLRHMRDTAFSSLGQQEDPHGNILALGNAPTFSVDKVTEAPRSGIARRIEGTITVPSFVTPTDPAPADNVSTRAETLCAGIPEDNMRSGCEALFEGVGIADGGSVPPNRLFYSPADGTADQQYGDGLPDSTGTMTTRFTCQIPEQASATNPARAAIYGHGLLDGHQAVTYERVPEFSRDYNFLLCAVDLFGFSTGDVPNVLSVLADLSNFAVIPDASQQGLLNYMFLARALRHQDGFGAHEAFRLNGQPVFDNSEVFYDSNSQGGIVGGALAAMSKDVQRAVLGVVGMNYSTLLRRSVDFDSEFNPTQPGLPPYAMPLYLSYPDDLDRDVGFALMQMLWDRSENNGYAHHISDNSVLKGPDNQVLLQPAFADHQVTHWSAQVMARTVGVEIADLYQRAPGDGVPFSYNNKFDFFTERDPDVEYFWQLPLIDRDNTAYDSPAGSLCVSGCRSDKSAFIEFDEGKTVTPPIGNIAPRGDEHDTVTPEASPMVCVRKPTSCIVRAG